MSIPLEQYIQRTKMLFSEDRVKNALFLWNTLLKDLSSEERIIFLETLRSFETQIESTSKDKIIRFPESFTLRSSL